MTTADITVPHIHVRHFGEGSTPALLLHCGQGRGGMWRGVAQHLHDRYAMTAPDFPGHGADHAPGSSRRGHRDLTGRDRS